MRKLFLIVLIILFLLPSCKKDDSPSTSGTATIENTLYGTGPYYANGFSFSLAKKVSTLEKPAPDIVLYVNSDGLPKLTFQANNFNSSFYKVGDYPDAATAITSFKSLKTVGTFRWEAMADPVNINQVWIYRTGSECYAKIRIISLVNEKRGTLAFGECTFEWLYQPDGSLTFPGK